MICLAYETPNNLKKKRMEELHRKKISQIGEKKHVAKVCIEYSYFC